MQLTIGYWLLAIDDCPSQADDQKPIANDQ
jgi:hypothetical protein